MAKNRNRAQRAEKTETPAIVEAPANTNEPTPEAAPAPETTPEPEHVDKHIRRSVVPLRWAKAYAQSQLKGTCDDQLAHILAGLTQTDGKADKAKIRALGWANQIDVEARWGERNVGMQRMNLGNVLRGRAKRGEPVNLEIGAKADAE